jgi:hypothetical protein
VNISIKEREKTLTLLEPQMKRLSALFKRCYLKLGRGALVVYTDMVENGHEPNEIDYSVADDAVDMFEDPKSRNDIDRMIANYDHKNEGILILITKSSATWFITCKLKK